ncbi:MAG: PIG-L deacetylase family protein [Actinomycetota bacterium]
MYKRRMDLAGPILGIWAHPDDETFLSAGLMAHAVNRGEKVTCVTATRGELGVQDPGRWPPERLVEIRELELKESLRILGVTEHRWLDYPDGGCHLVDDEDAVAKLVDIVEEIRPQQVLTFGPDGMTAHQDHMAVSRWTTLAFERAAPEGSRLLYATKTQEWADRFLPLMLSRHILMEEDADPPITPHHDLAIAFDLSVDLMELKTRSLLAQESQIGAMIDAFGDDVVWEVNRVEYFRLAASR